MRRLGTCRTFLIPMTFPPSSIFIVPVSCAGAVKLSASVMWWLWRGRYDVNAEYWDHMWWVSPESGIVTPDKVTVVDETSDGVAEQ